MSQIHLCRRNLVARARGVVDPEPILNIPCPAVWVPNTGAVFAPRTCETIMKYNITEGSKVLIITADGSICTYYRWRKWITKEIEWGDGYGK